MAKISGEDLFWRYDYILLRFWRKFLVKTSLRHYHTTIHLQFWLKFLVKTRLKVIFGQVKIFRANFVRPPPKKIDFVSYDYIFDKYTARLGLSTIGPFRISPIFKSKNKPKRINNSSW